MTNWLEIDKEHIWHPYSSIPSQYEIYEVESADGVMIRLKDGRELVDGMSSWWCAIHGYNHPELNQAIENQLKRMSHVMFGGLTHEPAARLAETLVNISPQGLEKVFFADSGSVSVEVAMKMAIQYWLAREKPGKNRFLTIRSGYHGDTFGAMSVCDPVTGMHGLFQANLMSQVFIDAPMSGFAEELSEFDRQNLDMAFQQYADELAAFILEPVVQGAGGMRFYSPAYLKYARQLCDRYDVLLIADEIATGFGRTGKLFACQHAGISPDIMCVGKALTGGYMTMAATLTTSEISDAISHGSPGVFMHGPTFMANPLACSVANASIDLLLNSNWQEKVSLLEIWLKDGLKACKKIPGVKAVRCLGAIGVVELSEPVNMKSLQPAIVDQGVWIRPFGKLVYLMPPFISEKIHIDRLTSAVRHVLTALEN